jgi:type II secretory pathway pseudopilin PulG
MTFAKRPGMSVIEVLMALGMASIMIFSVGNLVTATNRLSTASTAQEQASLIAQGQLEQIMSFANNPSTAGTIFSAANDGSKKYSLNTSGSPWTLQEVTSPPATAWLTLSADPTDPNIQTVTSYSEWMNGGRTNTESMTTILTDWKNLVPS